MGILDSYHMVPVIGWDNKFYQEIIFKLRFFKLSPGQTVFKLLFEKFSQRAVLGLQGIVVKCTAAIFFLTDDKRERP